jgi:hypothetical protein
MTMDLFVRGETLQLYMRRARLSDFGLAKRAYGADRGESQRRRVKLLKDSDITVLGTRGMTGSEEAEALAGALSIDPAWLSSPVVYSLFESGESVLALAPGCGALSFGDLATAHAAAVRIGESGLFPRPVALPVTEAEMLVCGFGPMQTWFNEGRPRFVSAGDVAWLLDLERVLRGFDTVGQRFPYGSGRHLGHLGWLLMVLRHDASAASEHEERERAWDRLGRVADLVSEFVRMYRDGAVVAR